MPTHKDLPPSPQLSVDRREEWYNVQKESGTMDTDSGQAPKLVLCLAGWSSIVLAIILALADQFILVALAICLALFLFYRAGEKS